jgi:hypothetical protein
MDDEIYECDHDEPNDHYEAFMATMDEFARIFQYCNEREQSLLARSIVAILRCRGGRFLVCDNSGDNLFEGGDQNALSVVLSVLRKKVERQKSEQAQRKAERAREERRTRKRKRPSEASETVGTSCHLSAGMVKSACEEKAGSSKRVDTPCHLAVGMLDVKHDETPGSRYFYC